MADVSVPFAKRGKVMGTSVKMGRNAHLRISEMRLRDSQSIMRKAQATMAGVVCSGAAAGSAAGVVAGEGTRTPGTPGYYFSRKSISFSY